jgi:aspartate-semialdehyde dehydrogenase
MPSRPVDVAVLGATGLVGRAVLEALAASDLDIATLKLLASPRSAGTRLEALGDELPVEAPAEGAFAGCDLAIFCAPPDVARLWAPRAWADGCAVVDSSPAFRLDPDVPLVVPEVNPADLARFRTRGIVSSPGGSVTALAVALGPIHAAAAIERLVVSTYQAVSGAGHRAIEQLEREATDLMNGREPDAGTAVPYRIAFNLLPQVGAFVEGGRTEEEARLEDETRKVLGHAALRVAATAVRVPLFYGHAAAVNVATTRKLPADEARALLRKAPGLKVVDDPAERIYPMPMLAVNDDAVLVGRIRDDRSQERGLDLFVVCDDLRKGAATNAVQLADRLAADHLAP